MLSVRLRLHMKGRILIYFLRRATFVPRLSVNPISGPSIVRCPFGLVIDRSCHLDVSAAIMSAFPLKRRMVAPFTSFRQIGLRLYSISRHLKQRREGRRIRRIQERLDDMFLNGGSIDDPVYVKDAGKRVLPGCFKYLVFTSELSCIPARSLSALTFKSSIAPTSLIMSIW